MRDAIPAVLGYCLLLAIAVAIAVVFHPGRGPAPKTLDCTFYGQDVTYRVTESQVTGNGGMVLAARDGREFAFPRWALVACVA